MNKHRETDTGPKDEVEERPEEQSDSDELTEEELANATGGINSDGSGNYNDAYDPAQTQKWGG